MEKLEGLLAGKAPLILVGSSFGGLMAAVYACLHEERVKKLILLAPALHSELYQPYLEKKLFVPIVLFHGRKDDVVPLAAVRVIAERLFMNLTMRKTSFLPKKILISVLSALNRIIDRLSESMKKLDFSM